MAPSSRDFAPVYRQKFNVNFFLLNLGFTSTSVCQKVLRRLRRILAEKNPVRNSTLVLFQADLLTLFWWCLFITNDKQIRVFIYIFSNIVGTFASEEGIANAERNYF